MNITYLTSDDFTETAKALHMKELSWAIQSLTPIAIQLIQRVENPITKLWWEGGTNEPYYEALYRYGNALLEEWQWRVAKNRALRDGVMRRVNRSRRVPPGFENFNRVMSYVQTVNTLLWPVSWPKEVYLSMKVLLIEQNPSHYRLYFPEVTNRDRMLPLYTTFPELKGQERRKDL